MVWQQDGVLWVDDMTAVDVPLISIVNPSTVNIKEVEMDFHVNVLDVDLKKKVAQEGFNTGEKEVAFDNRLKRSKHEVSFDGKNDHSSTHVKIKFEATPIPEGLSRVVDEYDKTISAFEIGGTTSENNNLIINNLNILHYGR